MITRAVKRTRPYIGAHLITATILRGALIDCNTRGIVWAQRISSEAIAVRCSRPIKHTPLWATAIVGYTVIDWWARDIIRLVASIARTVGEAWPIKNTVLIASTVGRVAVVDAAAVSTIMGWWRKWTDTLADWCTRAIWISAARGIVITERATVFSIVCWRIIPTLTWAVRKRHGG